MKIIMAVAIAAIALSACGKKNNDENAKALAADKVVSMQWCTVDSISGFSIITRYSFTRGKPNKTNISYLRLSDKGNPLIYNIEKSDNWVPKTDNTLLIDEYTVELLEDEFKVRYLDSTFQQKRYFKNFLKTNSNLKPSADGFDPKIAVSVKQRRPFSSKDSDFEQILFPCSNYSASFTATEPVRPMMEFNIFLGQRDLENNFSLRNSRLAKQMSFKFPMEQMNTSEVAVEGSSWCSWSQWSKDEDNFIINIMTFGKNQFISNRTSDFIFRDEFPGAIQMEIKEAELYSILENQKYVSGETTVYYSSINSSIKIKQMFAAMQDSNGSVVLVHTNSYNPDSTHLISFESIYFKCDDPRPFEKNLILKKNLPKLLALQRAKLQQH